VSPLRLHGLKQDLLSGEASCEGKGKGPETCSGRYLARLSYSYLLHNTFNSNRIIDIQQNKEKEPSAVSLFVSKYSTCIIPHFTVCIYDILKHGILGV
jgi:hypothetical protein